ncbi:TetR family transcriptional regulator [Chloroflexus sp.]|uniref:TetR family transcriptional regulator n=1 Tax=Chloroflexus sp. TaxID=1904827 RepID=UPI002ACD3427|nr:TetR family transcriptional regulator [Chloroflexus sp.]
MEQPADTTPSARRMLAAATALFAGYGYHGMSMRALAAATGRNVATIHYHFGNKLDRYRVVFRRLAERKYALIAAHIGHLPAQKVSLPLDTLALDRLQQAQTAGAIAPAVPDLRLILPSFTWIHCSYVAGGPFDPTGTRLALADPARMADLKQFLHLYIARLLGLSDPPAADDRDRA